MSLMLAAVRRHIKMGDGAQRKRLGQIRDDPRHPADVQESIVLEAFGQNGNRPRATAALLPNEPASRSGKVSRQS